MDPTISLEKHVNNLIRQVFPTKGIDWAYEKEWRLFLPLDDLAAFPHEISGRLHHFSLPAAAVKSIIVDARAPSATIDAIRQVLNDAREFGHVGLAKCKISETAYQILIEPVSRS